ncbi:hypothetical protein [Vibrio sp. HA2012]|uniref:hypothetical protein n=1 Tax=Vibrio sp. HA2012 TaxID=1971595 RepID=UPI0018E1F25A|nr:hypothetical protein [Vibrio sp. HA2012]
MDFIDKIRLRGQAEEDLFFAELDRQLIEAMHERLKHESEDKPKDIQSSIATQHRDK